MDQTRRNFWRRAIGALNALLGVVFGVLAIFGVIGSVQLLQRNTSDGPSVVAWTLFFAGIAAALIWIAIGDLRGSRRPSWVVRVALYVCVIAILVPTVEGFRASIRKQRAINNLKTLSEAVLKYQSTYKVRGPQPPATLPVNSASDSQ